MNTSLFTKRAFSTLNAMQARNNHFLNLLNTTTKLNPNQIDNISRILTTNFNEEQFKSFESNISANNSIQELDAFQLRKLMNLYVQSGRYSSSVASDISNRLKEVKIPDYSMRFYEQFDRPTMFWVWFFRMRCNVFGKVSKVVGVKLR